MRRSLWIVLFFATGVAMTSVTVGAQTRVLFAPLFVELSVAPGKSIETSFSLVNKGEKALGFSCVLSAVRQGERGECLPVEEIPDFLRWAKTPSSAFTVEPGERFAVPVKITVPSSAPPGSYTLGLVLTNTHVGGEEVNLGARLIGVIFLNVRRPGVAQTRSGRYAEIERFEVRQDERGIRFVAFLANRGRYFVDVEGRGRVVIADRNGKKVAEVPIGGGRGRVIPGNSVGFSALLVDPLPKGEYTALVQIDYGGLRPAGARLSFSCEGLKLLGGKAFVQRDTEENVPVVLSVSSTTVETKIVPGARRTLSIPVRNDFPLPVAVRAKLKDASSADSARCAEFASVDPEAFELPPYRTKTVRLSVNFPAVLPAGNKYLRVDLVPERAGEKGLSEELKEASTTSVFFLFDNVRGEKRKGLALKGVNVQLLQGESGFVPRFLITYLNTGNVHLNPSCQVELREIPKKEQGVVLERVGPVLYLRAEPSGELVLPGEEGTVVLTGEQSLAPGTYTLAITLLEGEEELLHEETTVTLKGH